MGYKTILVHCDAGRTAPGRARVALDVADRFDAHVIGLHVRQRFEAPVVSEAQSALELLYKSYEAVTKAEEAAASAAFKGAVGASGRSSEWRVVDGDAEEALVEHGRLADLVVLGQLDPDAPAAVTPPDLVEKVALASERPLLVVPHIGAAKPPGKKVMLCWNGRREASRAATGALPFLKAADEAIVLSIDPPSTNDRGEPGADVAGWLARHGVKVNVQRDTAADSDVGSIILSRAADQDVDLVIMGLYGHSRTREMVLGGASRTLLASMTVPLLVAH